MRRWKRDLARAGNRLLVTSRADIPNLTHLHVEELDPEDAHALFAHHYANLAEADRETLDELLDMVDRHTLLTEMLGKIGKQARYGVAELRDYLKGGFIRSPHLQRKVDTGTLTERKGLTRRHSWVSLPVRWHCARPQRARARLPALAGDIASEVFFLRFAGALVSDNSRRTAHLGSRYG